MYSLIMSSSFIGYCIYCTSFSLVLCMAQMEFMDSFLWENSIICVIMFIYLDENVQGRKNKLYRASDKPHSENILCISKTKQNPQSTAFKDFNFFFQFNKLKLCISFVMNVVLPWMLQKQGFSSRRNIFFPQREIHYVLFL